MAAQTPPSSSKLLKPHWDYDVFLSFRGVDTGESFTNHLSHALEKVGILTFLNDDKLPRGENISTILLNAIRGSMISIVVFSKGYASSSWCLDELVEIVHCRNSMGHTLIPIFCDVNPSDVRNQTGTFGKAFAGHEKQFWTDMEKVQRWRAALTEVVTASSSWILVDDANRLTEINKVVEEVLDLMNVPRHPKSVDSCVKIMTDLLNIGTSDIRIVGMSWMKASDAIGATSTKVVYEQICDGFEGCSFLDIRPFERQNSDRRSKRSLLHMGEISKKSNDLVRLQEQFLFDILKMKKKLSIKNVDEGINLIEETIKGKRVLIVLYGVDDLKQVNALVGNFKCFGPGSRVIATSEDEQLLTELEAHGKYEVEDLHYWNSLKLFSWRASMMAHPAEDFSEDYNYKQLEYVAGEGSEKQITSEPEEVVFDVEAVELTSNFSGLRLTEQPKYEDRNNDLSDLPGNPRRPDQLRMMPLSSQDALQILNLSGTGIGSLPKSIVKLVSLKRLFLNDCDYLKELPPEVGELEQLEVIDLQGSSIMDLPFSFFDYMPALQILNLSRTNIRSLPKSIVRLISLKRLFLNYCGYLKEFPPEVGELKQLEVLDLQGTKIRDLPENLRCPMLLELYLHYNNNLRTIPPSFFDNMPALQILNLSHTCIRSLPESIVRLVSLKRLILCFMELSLEVGDFEQLEVLDLEGTDIKYLPENLRFPKLLALFLHNNHKLRTIPPSFFNYMPALQILNLSKTHIRSLPESIVRLVSLKRLILSYPLLSKVGELKQIEVLDLEGTEIMDLHESVINLEGKEIMHLPENPNHPKSLVVFLHNNHKLKAIPPSFFDYVPAVQVLNLSRTGIRSLPESIFRLVSLKILILSYCHRFLRLSPKVGELKQLEVLDLEGTEIMDLPTEIKKLNNLTCLKFSIYGYMDDGSCSDMQSDALVPRRVISTLFCLEELMISVNPDDKRWNACVEDIVTEVCTLQELNTLLFYFPRVELVGHCLSNRRGSRVSLFESLSHFRFIVGHHVNRIMSRRPPGVELELERWAKCLEYINGDKAIPEEIKKVLRYSTAFFLERHATVKKLSDFGIKNMMQLKCCVVGECNEVEAIIDETDAHEEDDEVEASSGIVLGSLEYLCIYYMKNLRRIWEGPVQPKCLSLLKFLTLRTCPQLTTIFTKGLLDNLYNLEELTIDDCPSIKTLVSCVAEHKTSHFLPNLKRIALHFMPGLVSISSGLHIAPRLEWLSFYNCPNLKNLSIEEVSSKDLKKIEGERSWWEALKWSIDHPAYLDDIFVPINIEDY